MKQEPLKIKRADIALGAVMLLVAAALFVAGRIDSAAGTAEDVVVCIDGTEYGRYPLHTDAVIPLNTEYGHNVLTICGGEVRITEADCKGGDCMRMAPIRDGGGTIICLPHHLAVSVEAGPPDMDVLVQ